MKEYKIREFGELYRKGIVSLQEAATGAKIPYYQMMEYIQQENIRPPTQSKEDFQQEIEKSLKILKNT